MISHPFDNFLKARILCGDDDDTLQAACITYRLHLVPSVEDTHFDDLREHLSTVTPSIRRFLFPSTDQPARKPTKTALQKALVDPRMVTEPEKVQDVCGLRLRTNIRTGIEILALLGVHTSHILTRINNTYNAGLSLETVTAYLFYFFDCTGLAQHTLAQYLIAVKDQPHCKDLMPHADALFNDSEAVLVRHGLQENFNIIRDTQDVLAIAMSIMKREGRRGDRVGDDRFKDTMKATAPMIQALAAAQNVNEDGEEVDEMYRVRLEEKRVTVPKKMRSIADIGTPAHRIAQGEKDEGQDVA